MKHIQPEQPIYEIYTVDVTARTAEVVGEVAASAVISSKITQALGSGGTLELELKTRELWLSLYQSIKAQPTFLVRIIDGEPVNLFYLADPQMIMAVDGGESTYTWNIFGFDFTAWYLASKQVENNVYTEFIPEEGTADANIFNKFNTVDQGIAYHIEDIFSNMLPASLIPIIAATGVALPRPREKGRVTTELGDDQRQVAEFGAFDYSELTDIAPAGLGIYVRLKKGRTMLNMLNYVLDAFYNKGTDFAGRQRASYNAGTSKVDFTMYAPVTHDIDAKVSQRMITNYNYQLLTSTQYNDVLAESNVELDFNYFRQTDSYAALSSTRELWLESEPDENQNAASLETTARNELLDNSIDEVVTFDIDFTNFNFWSDLNEGDILNLYNFGDIFEGLNGTYKIYSFTEIIEDSSVSYTVDEMRKED